MVSDVSPLSTTLATGTLKGYCDIFGRVIVFYRHSIITYSISIVLYGLIYHNMFFVVLKRCWGYNMQMIKPLVTLLAVFLSAGVMLGFFGGRVQAQVVRPTMFLEMSEQATESSEATDSAQTSTSAAQLVVEQVTQKQEDITQPEPEVRGRLTQYLHDHPVGPLGPTNFLQHAIRYAVSQGVPGNTIVLVILFPLVAALVAASRHLLGIRGFGIFVPAILSVGFVATGVFTGILLFIIILIVASLARKGLRYLKLQYMPRMALLMWLVSVSVLGVMILSSWLGLEALMSLNIFPILILVLLAENFIEVQIGKSKREATELTIETIILALISSLILSLDLTQRVALLFPEAVLLLVALFDIFVGRFVGLRYSEYSKFKKLLKE